MSYTKLPDEKIADLYRDGTPVIDLQKRYHVTSGTIYRHLRSQGIKADRKTSIPWTTEENDQLISARRAGMTGSELYAEIPTRAHQRLNREFKDFEE